MPVAPFVPAIIGGIATIGGGLLSANASKNAAKTQAAAAQQGVQAQQQMYEQTRSDLAPYLTTGNSALSQLAQLFGLGSGGPSGATAQQATQALTQYPGYQFGFDQGIEALDRSAAAKGLVLSGGQRRDITQFGTNYALQQAWAPYLAQLNSMSQLGENAGAQVGQFGQNTANQIAQGYLNAGQATASGQVGAANAINGVISQIPGQFNSVYKQSGMADAIYKLSDERLKTDINPVGTTGDGLTIYTYRLKTGGPVEMGVMAQEVEGVRPEAVLTLPSGLKMVNYGALSPLEERMAA